MFILERFLCHNNYCDNYSNDTIDGMIMENEMGTSVLFLT